MSCPKCGSYDIVIVSSETLTFKCRKCGHTWSVDTRVGLVKTPSGEVHWSDKAYYRELAIEDAKDLLKQGRSEEDLLRELKSKYGNLFTDEELLKIVNKARKILELY